MSSTTSLGNRQHPSAIIAYGSSTGFTEDVATRLHRRLSSWVETLVDIRDIRAWELLKYDVLILGAPTWHVGELQDDWEDRLDELQEISLKGKIVALFGCGDAIGYPVTFQDAMGELWRQLASQSATLIGRWPIEGYEFMESEALTPDGQSFVGLALDEHNQYELTDERLEKWALQLEEELGLVPTRYAAGAMGTLQPHTVVGSRGLRQARLRVREGIDRLAHTRDRVLGHS